MIIRTLSTTHTAQSVFLLGSLAPGDLGENEATSACPPGFLRMRKDTMEHTWASPWKREVSKQVSGREQGKEAPPDTTFHLLLLKCVGLEMEGPGNSRFQ